ncbi:MAG: signal peptide peptidase SppA [Syntrophobacteraceae bacterium]
MIRIPLSLFLTTCLIFTFGCIKPKISIFPDRTAPLQEYTLQGKGTGKILLIPINGFISDSKRGLPFARKPNTVEEVVAQLKKAEKDNEIKAVILKIDSPGGSVTASDIIYHELTRFKECSGAKIVAVMMTVAASGGYYIALPADLIMAHPTTITGSIGVVFLRPNITGLMGKIGVDLEIDKSGLNKDMGSPFRKATGEERRMMQKLIDDLAERFITLAAKHRRLDAEARLQISSGRIYAADEALHLGLIDRTGYLDDAIRETAKISALPEDPKVVVYRRTEYHNDNLYNTSAGKPETPEINLIDPKIAELLPPLQSGFYYLWLPGQSD